MSTLSVSLTPDQQAALDAAGKQFNVDPRLIEAVYGKESSFGSNPYEIGQTNPFWAFGLISGPGSYNGYGYTPTGNTFQDAANTVAAFFASERKQFDAAAPQGQSFLQYADAVYSPPSSNPNSFANLKSIYSQLGGDPASEATYPGASATPAPANSGGLSAAQQQVNKIAQSLGLPPVYTTQGPFDQVAAAINTLNASANDWVLYGTFGALALALIGGGFAILAGGSNTVKTIEKGAALA